MSIRLMKSACEDEDHRFAGFCTQECADLVIQMSDGYEEPRVYGDHLGGTSSIDWSGCHRGPSMPEEVVEYDAVNRAVVIRTVHPEDCQCDDHED